MFSTGKGGSGLNGWSGLDELELLSITTKYRSRLGGVKRVRRLWVASPSADKPKLSGGTFRGSVRATLRAPAWSEIGWTRRSPGLVFWYAPFYNASRDRVVGRDAAEDEDEKVADEDDDAARRPVERGTETRPSFFFGEDIVDAAERNDLVRRATCVRAHLFAHRYANDHETIKDRLTYHSIVLLEWSHGKHCTVVELAWRNGLGGYKGRSNWIEDKNAPRTSLYDVIPPELKAPWINDRSEIRYIDVPARNVSEFEAYMVRHTGKGKSFRFYRPERQYSGSVAVAFRS